MMHRIIAAADDDTCIDHINGDGLDNRRANLRPATRAQNAANRRPRAGGSSRFKGVHWSKADNRWVARIHSGGRDITLGRFLGEYDAARAYNRAAVRVYGEFAYLNPVPDYPEQDPRRGGRPAKPWYWSQRDAWCITVGRKRIILARGRDNEAIAREAFDRLAAKDRTRSVHA
jgi:hypothetical protein